MQLSFHPPRPGVSDKEVITLFKLLQGTGGSVLLILQLESVDEEHPLFLCLCHGDTLQHSKEDQVFKDSEAESKSCDADKL